MEDRKIVKQQRAIRMHTCQFVLEIGQLSVREDTEIPINAHDEINQEQLSIWKHVKLPELH